MTFAQKLRQLKSDLADTHNPTVLAKWPNLASEVYVAELKMKIKAAESQPPDETVSVVWNWRKDGKAIRARV